MLDTLKEFLFCFSGKLDRATYWRRTLAAIALFIVLTKAVPGALDLIFFAAGKTNPLRSAAPSIQIGRVTWTQSWTFFVLVLPLAAALFWSLLSISARRLRDAGLPIWFLIFFMIVPVLLHLGYWIFYLYHPFSLAGTVNQYIAPGSWLHAPEYLFPRAFTPIWSVLELSSIRFYEIYEQATKELVLWPAYFSTEKLADLAIESFWRQHLGILVPAFCLSTWGAFVLGLRPSQVAESKT